MVSNDCKVHRPVLMSSFHSHRHEHIWQWLPVLSLSGRGLPSQPQSVTARWPVPIDPAWWQRHAHLCVWTTCLRLLQVAESGTASSRSSHAETFDSQVLRPNHYTTTPHSTTICLFYCTLSIYFPVPTVRMVILPRKLSAEKYAP